MNKLARFVKWLESELYAGHESKYDADIVKGMIERFQEAENDA